MKSEEYWVTFSKSGKIEDYLTFRTMRNEEDLKRKNNASKHKGSDS